MRVKYAIIAAAVLCAGCGQTRQMTEIQKDSVIVHITDSVTFRDTVIMVPLPDESDKAVLADTDTSRLRTSLAESEAYVSGGRLHHTLRNRSDMLLPVSVQYRDRARTEKSHTLDLKREVVEVPRELTRWQRFLQGLGLASLTAAAVWLALKFRRFV